MLYNVLGGTLNLAQSTLTSVTLTLSLKKMKAMQPVKTQSGLYAVTKTLVDSCFITAPNNRRTDDIISTGSDDGGDWRCQNSAILHAQNWPSCTELTKLHRNCKILQILFHSIALGSTLFAATARAKCLGVKVIK